MLFQFQIGAIRGNLNLDKTSEQIGFNSKLVRLEEVQQAALGSVSPCFNSKLVRLEEGDRHRQRLDEVVSIPNWCD